MEKRHGQCLCGSVKLAVDQDTKTMKACHCSMCRQWGGGPFMSLHANGNPIVEGEDNLSLYQSSEWATRGFCKSCGSNIFYKTGDDYYVLAGLFDNQDDFHMDAEIFIDEKPAYYDFSNDTKKMTGQEIFEMYAPKN